MRVAALAFGVFAGLVASLILALGGLDVPPELAAPDSRQEQAIRFGLFVIANLGVFGAALALAAPLASAVVLGLAAIAWVAAALLLRHSTDLVLVTPPALLLLAAIPALIAWFRGREAPEDEPDLEIVPPPRPARHAPLIVDADDEPPEIAMPAFAAAPEPDELPPARFTPALDEEWNPRRRRPPPPSARAAFRPVEVEDDEDDDDEPSWFARFALGLSSVLSFGLYAGLAVAVLLLVWTLRDVGTEPPAVAVADSAPVLSSVAPPAPSAASEPPALAPILAAPPQAPLLAAAPDGEADDTEAADDADFGDVIISGDPLAPPRLAAPNTLAVPEPAQEPAPEPAEPEPPPPEPSVAAPGRPVPYPMPPGMAVLRAAAAPVDLTGL